MHQLLGIAYGEDVGGVDRRHYGKHTAHGEQLKEHYRRIPFVLKEHMKYSGRGGKEQPHAWQHHIRREAIDFRHHAIEALAVVLHTAEHGQKGGVEYRGERCHAHFAPFVGLGVAPELGEVVECSYYK